MTIRPNSSFSVEQFNPKKNSTAKAVLRLYSGGIRANTGYISKNKRAAYKVKTGVATLDIQGTAFDVRLCKDDCEEENRKHKKAHDKLIERTVARAVFVQRGLVAHSVDGKSRTLKAGSAIFEGDTLVTKAKAYAILVFRDKSRISLQANTVFRVDEMKFDENTADDSTALFSLLRGGLRTVTGLIGKLNPRKYSMRTSVATIGIHGSGYDLMCTGACMVAGEHYEAKPISLAEGDGLYAYVWRRAIDFGGITLQKGKAAYIARRKADPVVLRSVPDFFTDNTVPAPDTFDVDEKALFSKLDTQRAPAGLYVSVTLGNVASNLKTGDRLQLKTGQAGYIDVLGREAKRLPKIPAFQEFDIYPGPDVPYPELINLNANSLAGSDSGMICEIK